MMTRVIELTTADEIAASYDVMHQLRTHIERDDYTQQVLMQIGEGYRLIAVEVEGVLCALAGFRISTNLFMGKNLYVDDLITDSECRSLGHGKLMTDFLEHLAREEHCTMLHLDSGTHRHDTHRFYFREGMNIASYHFSKAL